MERILLNFERAYQFEQFMIHFRENIDVAYQCYLSGKPYYLAIDIYILEEGEILHHYFRLFEKKVHIVHYQNFIKKFLRDPLYREQYLSNGEGNWGNVIDLDIFKEENNHYGYA